MNTPTPRDQLWAVQEQLHDIARRLERPGPHGAQYPSDVYDLLGALSVAARDIADITHRATRLLGDASDHHLTTRPLSDTDRRHLERAYHAAGHLTEALEQAQTAINDIGGHLTATAVASPQARPQPGPPPHHRAGTPCQRNSAASPPIRNRGTPWQGRRR